MNKEYLSQECYDPKEENFCSIAKVAKECQKIMKIAKNEVLDEDGVLDYFLVPFKNAPVEIWEYITSIMNSERTSRKSCLTKKYRELTR